MGTSGFSLGKKTLTIVKILKAHLRIYPVKFLTRRNRRFVIWAGPFEKDYDFHRRQEPETSLLYHGGRTVAYLKDMVGIQF
jgi:hypothetical protein